MRFRFLACLICVACFGCKTNPYAFVVPGSMAQRQKEDQKIKGAVVLLPQDERNMVTQFLFRESADEQATGKPGKDLTIRQIIDLEKPAYDAETASANRSLALSQAAGEARQKTIEQIQRSISFAMTNKQSIVSDVDNPSSKDKDQFLISLSIKNTSTKEISEAKGMIDIFAGKDMLYAFGIDLKGNLGPGNSTPWQTLQDVQRSAAETELIRAPVEQLHVAFLPDDLVFSDGQVLAVKGK